MSEAYTGVVSLGDSTGVYGYPNYTTLAAAYAAVPSGGAVLIAPGTYTTNGPVSVAKPVDFIAPFGATINPVSRTRGVLSFGDVECLIEGLTLQHVNSSDLELMLWSRARQAPLRFNGCTIIAPPLTYGALATLERAPPFTQTPVEFTHCAFVGGTEFTPGVFRWIGLDRIRLQRCLYSGSLTFQTYNEWLEFDAVTTPEQGYGPEYFWSLARLPLLTEFAGRVVDLLSNPTPRVVVFQWQNPTRARVVPVDSSGAWSLLLPSAEYGIYYLSQDNRCPPIIHGPYTAE